MLEIAIASCSQRGARESNQDDWRTGSTGAQHYAVLADGAGGHRDGAVAAYAAVEQVALRLANGTPFGAQRLTQAIAEAHVQLQREQGAAQGTQRMHATVVALWIDGAEQRALWSHVGDSRLYRVRHGAVQLLTSDDSVVQRMLDAGLLTERQAQTHPHKNQLVAALGMPDAVEPHTLPQPVALEDGDAYLLCTDGWWGSLERRDIAQTLCDASSADEWLVLMRAGIEARSQPTQDNFSAIGVWVGDPTQTTRIMADL
jgi:serine/threonine protein phosphatase PrpC